MFSERWNHCTRKRIQPATSKVPASVRDSRVARLAGDWPTTAIAAVVPTDAKRSVQKIESLVE
jgi:hypothetical protein